MCQHFSKSRRRKKKKFKRRRRLVKNRQRIFLLNSAVEENMHRRTEQGFRSIWRQISPRYAKLIISSVGLLVMFYVFFRLSIPYVPLETTTEETTTTTTTTTTPETTTEKSFRKFSFSKHNEIDLFFSLQNSVVSTRILRSHSPMVPLVH